MQIRRIAGLSERTAGERARNRLFSTVGKHRGIYCSFAYAPRMATIPGASLRTRFPPSRTVSLLCSYLPWQRLITPNFLKRSVSSAGVEITKQLDGVANLSLGLIKYRDEGDRGGLHAKTRGKVLRSRWGNNCEKVSSIFWGSYPRGTREF